MTDTIPIDKRFYHPIVHIINGQRLYYLLLQTTANTDYASQALADELRLSGLSKSSCAYLVFGGVDIVVRVWATDLKFIPFCDHLRRVRGLKIVRIILVNDMYTWYQHRIQSPQKTFDDFLNSELDPWQLLPPEPTKEVVTRLVTTSDPLRRPAAKYFVFAYEPHTSHTRLFEELVQQYKTGSEIFSAAHHISIYEFEETHRRGILIKGEGDPTSPDGNEAILRVTEELKKRKIGRTTTYIRAKDLKPEEHALDIDPPEPPSAYYNTRNALHYTCREVFAREQYTDTHYRGSRFTEIVAKFFPHALLSSDEWSTLLSHLRLIYGGIRGGRRGILLRFFMSKYAKVEEQLREALLEPRSNDCSLFSEYLNDKYERSLERAGRKMRALLNAAKGNAGDLVGMDTLRRLEGLFRTHGSGLVLTAEDYLAIQRALNIIDASILELTQSGAVRLDDDTLDETAKAVQRAFEEIKSSLTMKDTVKTMCTIIGEVPRADLRPTLAELGVCLGTVVGWAEKRPASRHEQNADHENSSRKSDDISTDDDDKNLQNSPNACQNSPGQTVDLPLLRKVAAAIETCHKDRNALAHGNINDLVKVAGRAYEYERFVSNYLELAIILKKGLVHIKLLSPVRPGGLKTQLQFGGVVSW